jgi:hypothetical protein
MNKTTPVWRPVEKRNTTSTNADLPEQCLVNKNGYQRCVLISTRIPVGIMVYSAMPVSNIPQSHTSDRSLTVAEVFVRPHVSTSICRFLIEELHLASLNSEGRANILHLSPPSTGRVSLLIFKTHLQECVFQWAPSRPSLDLPRPV